MQMEEDLRFVASGKVYWVIGFFFCKLMCFLLELLKANGEYKDKIKSGYSADQTMCSLSWDIEELKTLNSQGRTIHIMNCWLVLNTVPRECSNNTRFLGDWLLLESSYSEFCEEDCAF